MRLPLINSNALLQCTVQSVLEALPRRAGVASSPAGGLPHHELVAIDDPEQANEYLSYEMPALLLLNFSAGPLDAFAVMHRIRADPWLHYGGIIALYGDDSTYQRIHAITDSNIIVHLHHQEIPRQLGTVLEIIHSNQQILFQRALHTELLDSVSGQFVLDQDVLLAPAYANLVANYLFNVGLLDADAKAGVALALTEMLINAIEHGNCGITFEEKRAHLERHGTTQQLIEEKRAQPSIRNRRLQYRYDIDRERSVHVIRDEGCGFDWRPWMDDEPVHLLAEHGRGILLARQIANRVAYNEAGNEVTLEFLHTASGGNIPGVLRGNETLDCRPGEVIFNQGEVSDYLYYMAAGEFHVIANGKHVATLTPADMLMGEMSVLLEETRSATVVARRPGRLIKISKQDFIDIIKHQPYYGLFLSKLMARRLHRLSLGAL